MLCIDELVSWYLDLIQLSFLYQDFCIWFNVPFNTFQVIPGQCLLITVYDNHFTLYHTAVSHMMSRPVTLFWQQVNQFFHLNTLYVEHLTRELQLSIWNHWFWLGIETDTERMLYHKAISDITKDKMKKIIFTYWNDGGRLSPMPPRRSAGTSPACELSVHCDCVSDAVLLSAGTNCQRKNKVSLLEWKCDFCDIFRYI